jgi:hypothetical protein
MIIIIRLQNQKTKSIKKSHCVGLSSDNWYSDLQLLESGSEKIRQTVVRESEVNH